MTDIRHDNRSLLCPPADCLFWKRKYIYPYIANTPISTTTTENLTVRRRGRGALEEAGRPWTPWILKFDIFLIKGFLGFKLITCNVTIFVPPGKIFGYSWKNPLSPQEIIFLTPMTESYQCAFSVNRQESIHS